MLELMYSHPWWTTFWLFIIVAGIPSVKITRTKK